MQDNVQSTRLTCLNVSGNKLGFDFGRGVVFFFLTITTDSSAGEITHQIALVSLECGGQRRLLEAGHTLSNHGICRSFVNHYKRFCICDSERVICVPASQPACQPSNITYVRIIQC